MSKNEKNILKKGDIIFIRHKNIENEYTIHPLVVTSFGEKGLWAVDSKALFAAFTLSDSNSSYSKEISSKVSADDWTKILDTKKMNKSPSNKDEILQIDVLHLFSKDVLPGDIKGTIPESFVDAAIKVFELLEEKGEVSFNIYNITDVLKTKEDDNKEISKQK